MRVVIGGGSGFVGRELTRFLCKSGHEVTIISRQPGPGRITWDYQIPFTIALNGANSVAYWLSKKQQADLESSGLPPCEGAVNLAGENIFHPLRWWNESFKKDLFSSRIDTTRCLAKAIASSSSPPRAWVLVTGVACYKPSQMVHYAEETEWSPFNFFSLLVKEWEAAGSLPENVARNTRHVVVRSGLVLGADGGAIKQMLPPFRLGLGGPLGSGQQPCPWIHVADLAGIIARSLEPPSKPVPSVPEIYNGVAPALNTNYEFTKALGRVLRRPTVLPAPRFILQALLGAERAAVLTEGQWVLPKRTMESGYEFQYLNLESALMEIVRR